MRTREQVNNLISCLTHDEDLQQELWIHYLSGNSIDSLSDHLYKVQKEYSDDKIVQESIWQLISCPPTEHFFNFINNFTDFEKKLMMMLMFGFTIDKVSSHVGICQVRIRQAIASIRYNKSWEVYYGVKEASDRRREI